MTTIFISSESGFVGLPNQKELSYEFGILSNAIEKSLKKVWDQDKYGDVIKDFGLIMMNDEDKVFADLKWEEVRQFDEKTGDAEFRLKIDHDLYVNTDSEGRRKLIVKNVVDSLRELQKLTKGFDFKGDELISDFLAEVGYSEQEINNVTKVNN